MSLITEKPAVLGTMVRRCAGTLLIRTTNTFAGECEPDYEADVWVDYGERCHGTIDDDGMRELHPEGFT